MRNSFILCASVAILVTCLCSPTCAENDASLLQSVEPFFNLTEQFLDTIQPFEKSIAVLNLTNLVVNNASSIFTQWQTLAREYTLSYIGFVILAAIGILFIILVPIIGCCMCCCRCCCGKCGGRVRPTMKGNTSCRKICYGVILIILNTLMLCGIVLAFISNQLVHNSLDHQNSRFIVSNVVKGLSDTMTELQKVPKNARTESAKEISRAVNMIPGAVNDSMREFVHQISSVVKFLDATQAAKFSVQQISLSQERVRNVIQSESPYDSSITSLKSTLSEVQTNLSSVNRATCPSVASKDDCGILEDHLGTLNVTVANISFIVYKQLNSSEFGSTDTNNLTQIIVYAEGQYNNISNAAYDKLRPEIENAQKSLNDSNVLDNIWDQIQNFLEDVNKIVTGLKTTMNSTMTNPVTGKKETFAQLVTNFDQYRLYAFMAVGSIALLIIALYYLGLCFGFCGEPPYEDSRCCNSGVGANLVLSATGFAFLFTWFLMLLTFLLFLTGGLVQTEFCRYISGRSGVEGYQRLDQISRTAFSSVLGNGNSTSSSLISNAKLFEGIFHSCKNSSNSIAKALNIEKWIQTSLLNVKVDETINSTRQKLNNDKSYIDDVELLTPEVNDTLSKIESIITALKKVVGSLEQDIIEAKKAPIANSQTVLDAIKRIADDLEGKDPQADNFKLQHSLLSESLTNTTGITNTLRDELTGLLNAIKALNSSANGLRNAFDEKARMIKQPSVIEAGIVAALRLLKDRLLSVVSRAVDRILLSSGSCSELNKSLRRVVDAPCVTLLKPLNGFWAGLGIFLLFILPSIIFSMKLATLYRKTEKYQPDFEEPKNGRRSRVV